MKNQKWVAVGVILTLCSCSASKKAHKYFSDHPQEFSKDCADAYPVRDSVVTTDTFIKVVNHDYTSSIDSLSNSFDSLRSEKYNDSISASISHAKCKEVVNLRAAQINALNRQISKLREGYKPCLPDTVKIVNTTYRENTARVKYLEQQSEKKSNQVAQLQGRLKKNILTKWILILLVVGYLAGRIFKPTFLKFLK